MGRYLGAKNFGEFSIILGFVTFFYSFFEPRMQDLVSKLGWNLMENFDDEHEVIKDLFLIEVAGKFVICLALIFLSPFLVKFGNLPTNDINLIILLSIGMFIAKLGWGLTTGLLRVLGKTNLLVYFSLLDFSVRLILIIFCIIFLKLTVLLAILILLISSIVSNIFQLIFTYVNLKKRGMFFGEFIFLEFKSRLSKNKKFLFTNVFLSISDLMNKDLDVTLIAPFMPFDQIGLYKMAKNIALINWKIVEPFYIVLMPELSKLVMRNNFVDIRKLIKKLTYGLFLLMFGTSLLSYFLFRIYGEKFIGQSFADIINLLPLFFIGILISAPLFWGHPLSVATSKPEIALHGSLLGAFIGLLSFSILTPIYGAYGAAVAWSVAFSIFFISTSINSYGKFKEISRGKLT
jgi:O-antigen/teichoic acid export membrane protein